MEPALSGHLSLLGLESPFPLSSKRHQALRCLPWDNGRAGVFVTSPETALATSPSEEQDCSGGVWLFGGLPI